MLLRNCQLDGGASESITNNLDDFTVCWKIDPAPMIGVASNVIVSFVHRGWCNLVTRSGNIVHMIMF